VPISQATAFSGSKSFMIALSTPTGGASFGTPKQRDRHHHGTAVPASAGTIALSGSIMP